MRDVERKGIGTAVEAAVGPNEPGGEADQEGGADRGEMEEPERRHPNRTVPVGEMAGGAAEEEDDGDCEGEGNGDGDGEGSERSLGLGVLGFRSGSHCWIEMKSVI